MFSKLISVKKHSNQVITIEQLYNIVKNNPQKELIENLRSTQYKSKEYNNLKLKINCITPHGIFNSLTNDSLKSLSGYLFFDIDGFDSKKSLDDSIKRLIDDFPISFLQKSVGGRGINFLIKYDIEGFDSNKSLDDSKLTLNDIFLGVYNYVGKELINKGFNIDISASGLSRKMNISSDDNVYFNNVLSFSVNMLSIKECLNNLRIKDVKKIDGNMENKKDKEYILNDSSLKVIPIDELLNKIKTFTKYDKKIEGDYTIDEIETYDVRTFKYKIQDGQKRKTFYRIINGLFFLNNNIDLIDIYSYLFYINNNHTTIPMSTYELIRLVKSSYKRITETGEIHIKTKKKRIHFNRENNLSKKQKIKMANKINANLRVNRSIELIEKAKEQLEMNNELATQRKVSKLTGLGLATVSRHWNSHSKRDISNIKVEEITEENIESIEDKIETISEDSFFTQEKNNDEKIYQFKNKVLELREVTISKNDVKYFKNLLEDIKIKKGALDERTIMEWSNIGNDKTYFLYQQYLKKHNIYEIKENNK